MIVLKGRVLPCNGQQPIERGMVWVEGEKIVRVCAEQDCAIPPQAEIIAPAGASIMPGMIEQHCHIGNSGKPTSVDFYRTNPYEETVYMLEELSELLDAGFTTVRDMGGTANFLKNVWKKGKLHSPRIFAASKLISDTGGHGDEIQTFPLSFSRTGLSGVLIADGVEECRKGARLMFREGADFLKICTTGGVMSEGDNPNNANFSPEEIRVFVEEAELKGTYVSAHAEGRNGIYNALRSGVRSIEHGTYLDDDCLELMVRQDAWLIPTLSTMYLLNEMRDRLAPWTREKVGGIYETHCEAVRRAHAAGVKIGLGTDFIYDRSMMPYGRNAMELELLTSVGLSNEEALEAATRTGAEVVLQPDRLGTLDEGKLADILVVDGDPLADIRILQDAVRIRYVLLGGKIVKQPKA